MIIQVTSLTSPQHIIDVFRGNNTNNLSFVTIHNIGNAAQKLRSKYNQTATREYLSKNETILKCHSIYANKVFRIIAGSTALGMIIGGIVGYQLGGHIYIGGTIGGGVGGAAGFKICDYYDLLSKAEAESVSFHIVEDNELKKFKEQHTKDEYKLFIHFLENYIGFFSEEDKNTIDEFICSFSLDIPSEPVFSPHDVERKHVFEKKEIELHLDKWAETIAAEQNRGATLEHINELKKQAYPFQGLPFEKNELVYDPGYATKVIAFLTKVQKDISSKVTPETDPMIKQGLRCLLDHYRKTYTNATDAIVNKLGNDGFQLSYEYKIIHPICEEFRETYKRKIE